MVKWAPAIEAPQLADAAVQTRVLADAAVDTAKIATLAVTNAEIANATITKLKIGDQEVDIQRMLDPADGWTGGASSSNVSLTTTATSHVEFDITIPSWVGTAYIYATAWGQMSNSSGGSQGLNLRSVVDGWPTSGSGTQSIVDGTTGIGTMITVRALAAPASTITCETVAWLQSGTNSANSIQIYAFALFIR